MTEIKHTQPTRALRAAIYTRISKDATGEGEGVDRQQQACEALADSRGWLVENAHIYVENDTSATIGKRPVFDRMLAAAERGEFDVVIAWHVDRLTRKLTELESLIELAERTGIKFATVSGDLDLTTGQGRLVGRILASVARGEVEHKSARQKAANDQRAAKGMQPRTGRAYGYSLAGDVIDSEAQHVRDAFTALLAGVGTQAIADQLNNAGSRNVRGTLWTNGTIRHMLLNPRYIAERHMLRPGPDGRRVRTYVGPGSWTPIVEGATFRAADAILNSASRRAAGRAGNVRKYIGVGVFRCGLCDAPIKGHYGGTKQKDGTWKRDRKYACSDSSHLMRAAEHIDDYVLAAVSLRLQHPVIRDAFAKAQTNTTRIEELHAQLAQLKGRSRGLAISYARGSITLEQLSAASAEIDTLTADANRDFAEIGQANAMTTDTDPSTMFLNASPQQQAAVISTLVKVRVHPGRTGQRKPRNTADPVKMGEWAQLIASTIDLEWI